MSVTKEDIYHIAHLARLSIDETAIPEYTQNLNNIFTLVSQMEKINTQTISPMAHSMENLSQRFREDTITESNQREKFQEIAPQVIEGLYIVPPVIE